MNFQKYSVIEEGLVYIDHGPITMTLEARRNGGAFTEAAVAGAERVLEVFSELAVYLDHIRRPVGKSLLFQILHRVRYVKCLNPS